MKAKTKSELKITPVKILGKTCHVKHWGWGEAPQAFIRDVGECVRLFKALRLKVDGGQMLIDLSKVASAFSGFSEFRKHVQGLDVDSLKSLLRDACSNDLLIEEDGKYNTTAIRPTLRITKEDHDAMEAKGYVDTDVTNKADEVLYCVEVFKPNRKMSPKLRLRTYLRIGNDLFVETPGGQLEISRGRIFFIHREVLDLALAGRVTKSTVKSDYICDKSF